MKCGKLTAKLRDAVPVCFMDGSKEVKRYKNIEIPDEIKELEFEAYKFDVPETGAITFKIFFAPGTLPDIWPDARARQHRKPKYEEANVAEPLKETKEMKIQYQVSSEGRKALVQAIVTFLAYPPTYLAAPTFAYQIGPYTVDRTGMLIGPDNQGLLDFLAEQGFKD